MRKFLKFVIFVSLLLTVYALWPSTPRETITIPAPALKGTLTIERDARITMLMLNESFFMYKGEAHCVQKTLFWNFRIGYVNCGHSIMTNVHHTYGNANIPDNLYFTVKELNL